MSIAQANAWAASFAEVRHRLLLLEVQGARYVHRDVFRERVPGMCTKDPDRSLPFGAGAGVFALSCMQSRLRRLSPC